MRKFLLCTLGFAGITNVAFGEIITDQVSPLPNTGTQVYNRVCAGADMTAIPIECDKNITVANSCVDGAIGSVCNCGGDDLVNKDTQIAIAYKGEIKTSINNCHVSCTCSVSIDRYKCPKNTYGNPSNDSDASACQPCPEEGRTHNIGATDISECYLPAGSQLSDISGIYIFPQDCYWSK